MLKQTKIQKTAMKAQKRCLLEPQMLEMTIKNRVKFVRVVEVETDGFVLEVTFQKLPSPYYLATTRDPYSPRIFTHIQTPILKAQEIFAAKEIIDRLLG